MLYSVKKLEKNVKKDKTTAIGKTGKAYTNFDEQGNGKVEIEISGQLTVTDARNVSDTPINSFDVIEVVGVKDNILEVVKYVEKYAPEYYATLLMPAGITSEASIRYKDEDKLLDAADDVDRVYIEKVLPDKMKWNLKSISGFSFFVKSPIISPVSISVMTVPSGTLIIKSSVFAPLQPLP